MFLIQLITSTYNISLIGFKVVEASIQLVSQRFFSLFFLLLLSFNSVITLHDIHLADTWQTGQSRQGQVRHATWDLYYSALSLQLATGSSSIEGKLFRIIVDNTLQPHKSSYRRYFKDKEEKWSFFYLEVVEANIWVCLLLFLCVNRVILEDFLILPGSSKDRSNQKSLRAYIYKILNVVTGISSPTIILPQFYHYVEYIVFDIAHRNRNM